MPEAATTPDLQGLVPRCPQTSSNVRPRRIWDDLRGVRARRIAFGGGLFRESRTSSDIFSTIKCVECMSLVVAGFGELGLSQAAVVRIEGRASEIQSSTMAYRLPGRLATISRAGTSSSRMRDHCRPICVREPCLWSTPPSARDVLPGHGRPARPPCASASARAARSLGSLRCRL
jgi:hypothetical protein